MLVTRYFGVLGLLMAFVPVIMITGCGDTKSNDLGQITLTASDGASKHPKIETDWQYHILFPTTESVVVGPEEVIPITIGVVRVADVPAPTHIVAKVYTSDDKRKGPVIATRLFSEKKISEMKDTTLQIDKLDAAYVASIKAPKAKGEYRIELSSVRVKLSIDGSKIVEGNQTVNTFKKITVKVEQP
jgi:hypothetical protein